MRSTSLVSFLAALGLASTAFAAAPHPTAADADRDGVYVATVDVNADGTKNHLDIGVRASQYDCDDAHSTVSPKLTEIVGDGIDNDCSGADANWPAGITDVVAARFLANSGAKSPTVFIAEYDACKAATECEVDTVAGTFAIKPAFVETHKFADIYVNGSKVLRNNGQRPDGREVVTVEEFEHFRGGSASGSGSYTGPSKATRQAEAAAVATPLVAAETEARLAADAAHDSRLSTIETGNAGRDVELNRLGDVDAILEGRIADNEDAVAEESRLRAEADTALSGRIGTAERNASGAVTMADEALSHGVLVEGYGLGGIVTGSPTTRGERNSFGGGGGAGFNVGADLPTARVNVFGDLLVGYDGSDLMHSESVGLESTFQLGTSDLHLGPSVAYTSRFSQDNLLESAVVGRGPLVGLTLAAPFAQNGAGHGLFQVRAGCGPEWVGVKGDDVGEGVGLGCRATVGIGGGVGAPR